MPNSLTDEAAVEQVRKLDRERLDATRKGDAVTLSPLLDDELIYITVAGQAFNKEDYIRQIASHGITYDADFEFKEAEYRASAGLVILVGRMLGHARLAGEQQVFHLRGMSVWRGAEGCRREMCGSSLRGVSPAG